MLETLFRRHMVLTTVLRVLVRTDVPLWLLAFLLLWFSSRHLLMLVLCVTLVREVVPITVECTPVNRFLGRLGKAWQRRLATTMFSMELLRNLRCLPAGTSLPLHEHDWRITVSGRLLGTSDSLSCRIKLASLTFAIRVLL